MRTKTESISIHCLSAVAFVRARSLHTGALIIVAGVFGTASTARAQATRACCLADDCVELSVEHCESENGKYLGDGTKCIPGDRPGVEAVFEAFAPALPS